MSKKNSNDEDLAACLKELRLPAARGCYQELADSARREALSYEAYLLEVLQRECQLRRQHRMLHKTPCEAEPSPFGAPHAIATLLRGLHLPWVFCGGSAIDLFLNRPTRSHKDVDVAVFRKDQLAIRSHLVAHGWTLEKAVDGKFLPWAENEFIELPIHVIWCRKNAYRPDFLELLLNETDGRNLLFRRDQSIVLPLDRALLRSESGFPILAPEIVMLYNAKDSASEGNASDFAAVLPHLDDQQRTWLAKGLKKLHPGHPWLRQHQGFDRS